MSDGLPQLTCFHGSPGAPDEFLPMQRFVRNGIVLRPVREGYPEPELPIPAHRVPGAPDYFLGYSWGAMDCLRQALQDSPKGVLLVAPYLFPKNKLGGAKKTLIQMPFIGDALLKRAADQVIDEMLKKSSFPRPVPDDYRRIGELLKKPEYLRRAALEKEEIVLSPIEALQALASRKVRLGLVWGSHDLTSGEAEQVEPLQKAVRFDLVEKLQGAGHAIPWTHPMELARIVDRFLMEAK